MPFASILFPNPGTRPGDGTVPQPAFFPDLALDRILALLTQGREAYRLTGLFLTPLEDPQEVRYRHQVFQDLEIPETLAAIQAFASGMSSVRAHLGQAQKFYYRRQKERLFLDAVHLYCGSVKDLALRLKKAPIQSEGLMRFRGFLEAYAESPVFTDLCAEARQLLDELSGLTYCVHVKDATVTVRRYHGEEDYSQQVEATFQKFRHGSTKDYRVDLIDYPEMNHVEAQILDLVAKLYENLFQRIERFCIQNERFIEPKLEEFDREIQFYLAFIDFMRPLRSSGLSFCYPTFGDTRGPFHAKAIFDMALAHRLVAEGQPIVCNDWNLDVGERIMVVSGPNHGGKTTFARAFGQLHYFAKMGCPVPAQEAELLMYDHLFTHFEKQEYIAELRGKLEDDLIRMRDILTNSSEKTIVIINEMLASTTLRDGIVIGKRIVAALQKVGMLAVWVTFIEELAQDASAVVSMVSGVDPHDPSVRTFRIERRPPGGIAYALAMAERYGLTYTALRGRLDP